MWIGALLLSTLAGGLAFTLTLLGGHGLAHAVINGWALQLGLFLGLAVFPAWGRRTARRG